MKPSDGEVYRKIRQYERNGNICFKKRWKALLSDHGRRGLRQLFDRGDGELTAAFDDLLDIPGLWDGMRISTLHKMIGMNCDEVGLLSLRSLLAYVMNRRFCTILNTSKRSGTGSSVKIPPLSEGWIRPP